MDTKRCTIEMNVSPGSRIGAPDAGNVISGNNDWGVTASSDRRLIKGKLVGTSAGGMAALGNGRGGMDVSGDNARNGGTDAGAADVISRDGRGTLAGPGLALSGDHGQVYGNRIGTTRDGLTALANDGPGVIVTRVGRGGLDGRRSV